MLKATLPPKTSAEAVNEDGFDVMSKVDETEDDEVALQFTKALSVILIAH
jgi:hypothetical protein